MDLTNSTRSIILNALRKKKITQTELAERMGYGKAWASRLLNGGLKSLNDEATDKLEKILDVRLTQFGRLQDVS